MHGTTVKITEGCEFQTWS